MRAIIIEELLQVAYKSEYWDEAFTKERLANPIVLKKVATEIDQIAQGKRIVSEINKRELNELVSKLLDNVITINQNVGPPSSLASDYFYCLKKLFVAEILNLLMMKNAALYIANDVIRLAKKKLFLKIVFQANVLIYTQQNKLGNDTKEINAVNEFRKYLKFFEIESELDIHRNELFRYYNRFQANNPKVLDKCIQVEKQFAKYVNKVPSFYFHNNFFFILHIKYIILKDHKKVFLNSQEAIAWFQKNSPDYRPGILTFTYVQIVYTIQKKQFDKCQVLINSAFEIVKTKSLHWFRITENELLMHLHNGQYSHAASIYYNAVSSSSFLSIQPIDADRWKLYEIYIQFLIQVHKADPPENVKRFSVTKLINDLPRFSKDKRAMNIPLLIAQMLFLIIKKRYNEAADRIEALGKYSTRYLLNDETFRSNCFIKILLTIPKSGFNQTMVKRKAQPVLTRMISSEIELIDQPFEIEIIPYEDLWAILLEHLSQKHHYRDNRSKELKLEPNR